ncbi:slipin family protein [Hyalangium versicolor]|uniref:slipin family protein n=1 Tax=Hyalangium versicolor TaxID=2861190 RepID=UPI001CCD54CF|nr:slipin family protein [Hyalangium versicolor]
MDVTIKEGTLGLLYENGVLVRTLNPGRHRFFTGFWLPRREVVRVDLRERSLTIKNQEILTSDKVAVRLSLLLYFKVVDPRAALLNVEHYEERIYEDVQLAARRFLTSRTLDQILRDRSELSDAIREDVRASAQSYGVEVRRADVKDLVFPGNLREIMNRVIETERESEAKLIEARKLAEVSRLEAEAHAVAVERRMTADEKAAQLLAANPLLVRIKELEVLREIGLRGGNHFHIGMDPLGRRKEPG